MIEVSWPLLLGPYALTVGLIVAVITLYNGRLINPSKVVPRADFDALKLESATNTSAVVKMASAVDRLAKRARGKATGGG